jgi:hypothetical protein
MNGDSELLSSHLIAGCLLTLFYSKRCGWMKGIFIPQIGCGDNKEKILPKKNRITVLRF